MNVRFKQTSFGWCTVYMWANLLNNESVLALTVEPQFKACSGEDEDRLLATFSPEITMKGVAACEQSYPHLPKSYIWDILQREDDHKLFEHQVIPYVLVVRLMPEYYHSVAVVKTDIGLFYLDPYASHWIELKDLQHFSQMFLDCQGIYRPIMRNDHSKFASFNAEYYDYPFYKISKLATV